MMRFQLPLYQLKGTISSMILLESLGCSAVLVTAMVCEPLTRPDCHRRYGQQPKGSYELEEWVPAVRDTQSQVGKCRRFWTGFTNSFKVWYNMLMLTLSARWQLSDLTSGIETRSTTEWESSPTGIWRCLGQGESGICQSGDER